MLFDQLYGCSNVSILIQTASIVIEVKIHKKYLLWGLQLHDEQADMQLLYPGHVSRTMLNTVHVV